MLMLILCHITVYHMQFLAFLTGLMADKLGSYTVPFYTTGAILIAGASITSLMACVKQQPEEADEMELYEEELLVTEKITVL